MTNVVDFPAKTTTGVPAPKADVDHVDPLAAAMEQALIDYLQQHTRHMSPHQRSILMSAAGSALLANIFLDTAGFGNLHRLPQYLCLVAQQMSQHISNRFLRILRGEG